jgi:glycosyltransferase involved in cell wall biosynthesis
MASERVLHTLRSLRVDGVVKVVLRNLEHFTDPAFEHRVCSMMPDGELRDAFRAAGADPLTAGYRGPADAAGAVRRLVRIIRDHDIGLVHANRTLDLVLAGAAARICGIPVVSTVHWLPRLQDHPHEQQRRLWRGAKYLAGIAARRALVDRYVGVSEAVREAHATLPLIGRAPVAVVYPGLDMRAATPPGAADRERLRSRLGLACDTPVVLNVGRLHAVKGQHYLVPMMRELRARVPDAVLLIAGEGDRRAALTRAVGAAGLDGAVRLLGLRHDVDALLAASDVLVVSSESEAAGLPLYEAMRAGRPVVAHDVGGIREMVVEGETGFLVPCGDTARMAAAVADLLEDPARAAAMGEAGRRLGLERFDIRVSVAALERLDHDLTG